MQKFFLGVSLILSLGCFKKQEAVVFEDKYLWLEDIESKEALSLVKAESKKTVDEFTANQDFKDSKKRILKTLEDKKKLLYVSRRGDYVYNFWRDAKSVKGLWRRTLFVDYKKIRPKWETLIDFDKLAKKENKSWVFKGAECYLKDFNRCLVALSNGGKDAVERREFDLKTKSFVKDGFFIPEAKGSVSWLNKDTLLISSSIYKDKVTTSGYPSTVRVLKRGEELEAAKLIFETKSENLGVWGYKVNTEDGKEYDVVEESLDFYNSNVYLYKESSLLKVTVPTSSSFKLIFRDKLFFEARGDSEIDGVKFIKGSVFYKEFNEEKNTFSKAKLFFKPSPEESFKNLTATKNYLVLATLKNVLRKVRLYDAKLKEMLLKDKATSMFAGKFSVIDSDPDSDEIILKVDGFLKPAQLILLNVKTETSKVLQKETSYFDADKFKWSQDWAVSDDGTKIPFFIVSKKELKLDSKRPTIMYGYGGFQISLEPRYFKTQVSEWVKGDRAYVIANIRGGGEYGPSWHQKALVLNKKKSYEDFAAVAKRLFELKVTSPKHLGIMGGSNGGLLVGASMVLYPELYGAVFCSVPLLDMLRYHKLPPGASWMAEYGDPEKKEERDYISTYSPYQNVKADGKYPQALFYTSTFDDRVQPGHARKMYKKMKDQGHRVHYYENSEGGHAGAADLKQIAFKSALSYSYFKAKLDNQIKGSN